MTVDQPDPVRTFVLVPERNLGHAIARKLREDPAIHVIGVSTDPNKDAYWIFDADPDVIIADFQAGGLEFLFTDRLPPGNHRIVFFAPPFRRRGAMPATRPWFTAPRGSCAGPAPAEEVAHCDALLESVREGTPMRPADCPAVKRLQEEEAG